MIPLARPLKRDTARIPQQKNRHRLSDKDPRYRKSSRVTFQKRHAEGHMQAHKVLFMNFRFANAWGRQKKHGLRALTLSPAHHCPQPPLRLRFRARANCVHMWERQPQLARRAMQVDLRD